MVVDAELSEKPSPASMTPNMSPVHTLVEESFCLLCGSFPSQKSNHRVSRNIYIYISGHREINCSSHTAVPAITSPWGFLFTGCWRLTERLYSRISIPPVRRRDGQFPEARGIVHSSSASCCPQGLASVDVLGPQDLAAVDVLSREHLLFPSTSDRARSLPPTRRPCSRGTRASFPPPSIPPLPKLVYIVMSAVSCEQASLRVLCAGPRAKTSPMRAWRSSSGPLLCCSRRGIVPPTPS